MAVAGLDRAKCKNVQCDVVEVGSRPERHPRRGHLQSAQSDGHRESNGIDSWIGFRHVAQLLEPERDPGHTERFWKYLHTERPLVVVGSPKCKDFIGMYTLDQTVLDAAVSHLKNVSVTV